MGSETILKLPVIDFNSLDLESKNPKWEEVKSQVHKALEECGCFEALFDKKVESLETTLWPEGFPSFSKTIQAFSEQLSELDQKVRKMVLESLGVEKYLDEHMNSTNYLLRVMKYSAPQIEDAQHGIDSHTDKNIVTTLCQLNGISGLEVETKDGKWITYQPSSPHSFVVMIGDSFHVSPLYKAYPDKNQLERPCLD
ncbi:hypothetical protein K1719_033428 [Acacia pycnantha]|nr:hypothetical protein K1719_033428 [Acacia pycnantha]